MLARRSVSAGGMSTFQYLHNAVIEERPHSYMESCSTNGRSRTLASLESIGRGVLAVVAQAAHARPMATKRAALAHALMSGFPVRSCGVLRPRKVHWKCSMRAA